jgi:hypothetical protein
MESALLKRNDRLYVLIIYNVSVCISAADGSGSQGFGGKCLTRAVTVWFGYDG